MPSTYVEMRENIERVLHFMSSKKIRMHHIQAKGTVKNCTYLEWEAPLPSGRASDSGARGQGLEAHSGRRVVSLSKMHLPPKKYW